MNGDVEHQRKQFEIAVEARVKKRTAELEQKIFGMKRTIESLQNDLFDHRQREVHHDTVMKERDHLSCVVKKLKNEKAKIMQDHCNRLEASSATLDRSMRQCSILQEENQRLNALLKEREAALNVLVNASPSCTDPEHSSELLAAERSNFLRLQSENRALELRYDRMRAQKRRISAGWRKDWKLWKECKNALMRDKGDRTKVIKHLTQFEEDCEYEKLVKEKGVEGNSSEGKGWDKGSVKSEEKEEKSASAPLKDADVNVIENPFSQTQEWSYHDPPPPQATTIVIRPSQLPGKPLSAQMGVEVRSEPQSPKPDKVFTLDSSPTTIRAKRKGEEAFADDKGNSPSTKKPAQPLVFEEIPETPSPPKRISKNLDSNKTINAEFAVNEDANGGLKHQYDAVVRNKSERMKLHAVDCECCRDYYAAIGPLPPRLQAPLWATPPKRVNKSAENDIASDFESSPTRVDRHRQKIGRHRQQWKGPQTPPDFWEIGFPDTQRVVDINSRAEEMHREKRRQIEEEASRPNGRYKRRT